MVSLRKEKHAAPPLGERLQKIITHREMESLRQIPKRLHSLGLWWMNQEISSTSPAHSMLPCTLGEGLTPHWLSFHTQQSTTSTVTAYCRQRYLCIVAQGSANTPRSQQSNTCKQVGCYFLHKQQYRMKNPKYPNTINCVKKHRLKAYKQTCIHKEKNTPCFLLQSWTPCKGKAAASRTSKLHSRI